jgi:hypothetical protein
MLSDGIALNLECGDLSPLCIRRDLSRRTYEEKSRRRTANRLVFGRRDKSRRIQSGDKSPHSKSRAMSHPGKLQSATRLK